MDKDFPKLKSSKGYEGLENQDNILHKKSSIFGRMDQLCSTARIDFSDSERARPTGFQLTRENLESRIKEQHLITNIENVVFDLVIMKLFTRVEGDKLCRRLDDMGYNRLRFCMRYEMPIMRLLACHSTRHGFLPPSFLECVSIRGWSPQHAYSFVGGML
nr:hypothetical protein [Tanacetum cinerariifolium]